MYRQGLTTTQIAATARVGKSIVRYHLAITAKAYASIRDEQRSPHSTGHPGHRRGAAEPQRHDRPVAGRRPTPVFPFVLCPGTGTGHLASQKATGPRPGNPLPHLQHCAAGNPRLGPADPHLHRRSPLEPTPPGAHRLCGRRARLATPQKDGHRRRTPPGHVAAHPTHEIPPQRTKPGQRITTEHAHTRLA